VHVGKKWGCLYRRAKPRVWESFSSKQGGEERGRHDRGGAGGNGGGGSGQGVKGSATHGGARPQVNFCSGGTRAR
jgi:hypothetical protein